MVILVIVAVYGCTGYGSAYGCAIVAKGCTIHSTVVVVVYSCTGCHS